MKYTYKSIATAICMMLVGSLASCDDNKSYSELLNEEEHAVNWFLAKHKVCLEIPEDGNFIVGEDAPYYKMDDDGFVYMQVLDKGDEVASNATETEKEDAEFQIGNKVYFRFMRMNLKYYQLYGEEVWEGNAEDMSPNSGNAYFVYGNTILTSTTQYGEGLQVPLEYLNNNCKVNLIIKSPQGFSSEQSSCIPYEYNIQYFKAIY